MNTNRNRPSLTRAGLIFGTALVASLGVGILIQSSESPKSVSPKKVARAEQRPAPRAQAHTVPEAPKQVPTIVTPEPVVESAPVAVAEPLPPIAYPEAEAAYLRGDWDEAATAFARFTDENPENLWGWYMAGLSHRKVGELEASEAAFRSALTIEPDHEKSLVNLARTLLAEDRAEDALEPIKRAVELDPSAGDAQRVLGRTLHSLERRDEAVEAYRAALAIDGNDAWALNNLGLIRIEQERFDEAVEPLTRACEIDGTVACFHNNLGVALERTGEAEDAVVAFQRALEADAGYEKARTSLARVEAAVLAAPDVPADPTTPVPVEGEVALASSEETTPSPADSSAE